MHMHTGIHRSSSGCWVTSDGRGQTSFFLRGACLKICLQSWSSAAVTENHYEQDDYFGFLNAQWSPT